MSATLTTIGSSSAGNGYLLQVGDESLILECGMPAREAFKLLDWRIDGVAACICSHRATPRPRQVFETIH